MTRAGGTFVLLVTATTVACSSNSDDCVATRTCSAGASSSGPEAGTGGARENWDGSASGGATTNTGGAGNAAGSGGASGSAGTGGKSGASGADGAPGTKPDAGGADSGSHTPTCDVTKSPKDEPCLVSNDYSIFVAPGGTGTGTLESPLGSIVGAVALARTPQRKKIIVCSDFATRFHEQLALTSKDNGLGIFGGFTCPGEDAGAWKYDGTIQNGEPRTMSAASASPALTVTGVARLVVEDMGFSATAATKPGSSSIAAIVTGSVDVVFRRALFAGLSGTAGADGAKGSAGADAALPGAAQRGQNYVCNGSTLPSAQPGGLWPSASSCGSQGGKGASANSGDNASAAATMGLPATDVVPPNFDNAGESQWQTAGGSLVPVAGLMGALGKSGAPGAAAAELGLFTNSGYVPANGNPGTDGYAGQGGGGGGASQSPVNAPFCAGASGGAGGMGGCGGGHGSEGRGGGASVGLILWDSALTLDTTTVTAVTAGKGGKGGDGGQPSAGQSGGYGGLGNGGTIPSAGDGGKGGLGGAGGPGSGGSGGPSFALVFHRAPPAEVGTNTFATKAGGSPGKGGVAATPYGLTYGVDGAQGASALRFEQK